MVFAIFLDRRLCNGKIIQFFIPLEFALNNRDQYLFTGNCCGKGYFITTGGAHKQTTVESCGADNSEPGHIDIRYVSDLDTELCCLNITVLRNIDN